MSKADDPAEELDLPAHGASTLPRVTVDSYNVEIEDDDGFVGDKASKSAFWKLVDKWRKPYEKAEKDPLGKKASTKIGKQGLATLLAAGDAKAAAVVASAVDEYAHELATVIRRYLRLKDWRDTECIVVGGGFSSSRLGQLAIARTELLLRAEDIALDLDIIQNHPDEAGLIGAVHLLPTWMLKGHNGMLAVDVGGTNFRAGVIEFGKRSADLAKARVVKVERWRHRDEDVTRDQATRRLIRMLRRLIGWAKRHEIELVPLVGVACPGIIEEDGSITRGGQNLPGNWESSRFNLPAVIRAGIPKIGKDEALVVMHSDAVVQGLSELPRMRGRKNWGALTIGTGLGNARYTNRKPNGGKG
jgi:predicted NBD/HSP70 family sugar kinase